MSNPYGHLKHGLSKTPLYNVWQTMKQRCENPNSRGYKWYGAKGISVCKEWQSVETFYKWAVNNGYEEGLTIDRIDGNQDYCPANCRWVTIVSQQNNRSSNRRVTHDGKTLTITEWSKITGIARTTITNRLRLGWSITEALAPKRRRENTLCE